MNYLENKIRLHEKDIAKILAQLCHHVAPEIIEAIQESNRNDVEIFKNLYRDCLDLTPYLFPGSACVFPGVRRYVKMRGKKKRWNSDYGAIVDDNTFPRHLWCFLAGDRCYTGPNWKAMGLSEFELAHVFTHKESELEMESAFFENIDEDLQPYGDFTCACNVVLLPKGMVRPTDNSEAIKSVFYQRYIELYGEVPLNGRTGFRCEKVPEWYGDLEWNQPFGPEGWEQSIDALMAYRRKRLAEIIELEGGQPSESG